MHDGTRVAFACATVVCAPVVCATVVCAPATARADAPALPPPWLVDKPHLHDAELRKKVEGSYPTAIPLLDADPDTGYGGGARAYYYWNGRRDDPLFEYTPYRHRVFLQVFASNKGFQDHQLDYEWLYVGDAPVRFHATAILMANAAANYFGVGSDAMRPLTSPSTFATFDRYSDYLASNRQVDALGRTYAAYNQYDYLNPALRLRADRELFGGLLRAQVGVRVGYVRVRDATGQRVSADAADGSSTTGFSQPTKLHDDCAMGRVIGCSGGWDDSIEVGVAYDSRDFEPDPNVGAFVELTSEVGTRLLGSSFDWARVTFSPRVFWSPFPSFADVVLAARFLVNAQTGVPFFDMDTLSSTVENTHGLGGSRTLRGYRLDRFVGPIALLANAEVRWTMFDVKVLEQRFAFALVPFVDVGRVFDSFRDLTVRGWRRGQGVGVRVAWNQSTIGAFDLGVSGEDTLFYTEFNHPF